MTENKYANLLQGNDFLRFPRTLNGANILVRRRLLSMGRGHNATTFCYCSVVAHVVGFYRLVTKAYTQPTTPQRLNQPLTCVCTGARMRMCQSVFYRCSVVLYIYLIDIYRERDTTAPTTQLPEWLKCVVARVVTLSNPLKNNKKGGLAHG